MRVLLCSFAEPSFLYPLIGLAAELTARGHHVAFVSGQGAIAPLAAAGMERIPRGSSDGESFNLRAWANPLCTAIDVKHIEFAVARFQPQLLVTHQLGQAAVIVRERTNIPLAVMGLFAYLWPVGQPVHRALFDATEPTRAWRLDDNHRCLDESRALFHLPPVDRSAERSPLLGDAFMLRTAPFFEPELDVLPPQVHAVGACLWEPRVDALSAWNDLRSSFVDAGAPVVYAQQGRVFGGPGFWRPLVEAAAELPVQVVAVTGRMDAPVGTLPPNVLVRDFVSQRVIFPHAAVAISGGHSTSVLGALTHGVPQIVVPGGGETTDNAARLELAGCAHVIEAPGLGADVVGDAIRSVMASAEIRDACGVARAAMGAASDFGPAADIVELTGRGMMPRRDATLSACETAARSL